jgi:pyruvate formate-lyase activating enzyme-like uncharacterized protein
MNQNHAWKERVQGIFQTCSDEIKKTTEIGMKMLSASKTNSQLHESYEELGHLVYKAMKNKEIDWDNARAKELMTLIMSCKKDLKDLEEEVVKIKETSPPQD